MSRRPERCVRAMSDYDIDDVVRVHMRSFSSFFLSSLGPRFLARYYRAAIDDVSTVSFVAAAPDGIAGVIVGSIDPGGFYGRLLKRHALGFAVDAAPALLRRPSIILRLLRALRKPKQAGQPEGTVAIFSLAVDPDEQGAGLGRRLCEAFEAESAKRGVRTVVLETDADCNEDTLAFYRALGFARIRLYETREGRRMLELGKPVAGSSEVTTIE